MDQVSLENLFDIKYTNETRTSWSAIAPENKIVSLGIVFRSDKEIMGANKWLNLKSEVTTVHFELIAEFIVTF